MTDITPADRELAASYAVLSEMRDLIRAGKAEHHAEPVAAHREAHEAPLKARIAELEHALRDIQAEMKFPNQLESGFVHGKPTYKDLFNRVCIALAITRAALKGQTDG